jgi:hypothetical protein
MKNMLWLIAVQLLLISPVFGQEKMILIEMSKESQESVREKCSEFPSVLEVLTEDEKKKIKNFSLNASYCEKGEGIYAFYDYIVIDSSCLDAQGEVNVERIEESVLFFLKEGKIESIMIMLPSIRLVIAGKYCHTEILNDEGDRKVSGCSLFSLEGEKEYLEFFSLWEHLIPEKGYLDSCKE